MGRVCTIGGSTKFVLNALCTSKSKRNTSRQAMLGLGILNSLISHHAVHVLIPNSQFKLNSGKITLILKQIICVAKRMPLNGQNIFLMDRQQSRSGSRRNSNVGWVQKIFLLRWVAGECKHAFSLQTGRTFWCSYQQIGTTNLVVWTGYHQRLV